MYTTADHARSRWTGETPLSGNSFQLAGMRSTRLRRDTGRVATGGALRCVIVDNNHDFLDAAARLLERQNIEVVGVAHSSSAGVQCVQDLRPDVTLVDIELDGESGFDLAEQLHRGGADAAPTVILISTHAEEDFAELISTSPAVAFLPKAVVSGAAIREILGIAS